jgi:predicted ester cyclase
MEVAMRIVLLASVIVASVIVAGVIVAGAPVEARAADVEANKALLRRSIEEIWNQRNPEAAERYIAADLIEHNPNIPQGLEGRKKFIAAVQAAFSDYHAEVQEIIAEGDKLVARIVWTGTQDGSFLGRPATGNRLRFSTSDFLRIENGKFVEHWDVVDSLPRAIALGLVPPPVRPGGGAASK